MFHSMKPLSMANSPWRNKITRGVTASWSDMVRWLLNDCCYAGRLSERFVEAAHIELGKLLRKSPVEIDVCYAPENENLPVLLRSAG